MLGDHVTLGLSLRAAEADDDGLLFEVFYQTRRAEFAPMGWPEAALRELLRDQHRIQSRSYRGSFPAARFDVVLADGAPVGRLYVEHGVDSLHLIDIALLPEHRGRGLGRELLARLIQEADASGKAITLQVESNSPVQAWYARLGFLPLESQGFSTAMRRPAAASLARPGGA